MARFKGSKIGKILDKLIILSNIYLEKNHDLEKSIVVTGTGRSGTTWLAEILMNILKYRLIFEPFNPRKVKICKNFPNKLYLTSDDDNVEYIKIFKKILSGKIRNIWINQDNRVFRPKGRIVKSIRANLFLGFLRKNFPSIPIVCILRHPCAVVLSRFQKGWGDKDLDIIMAQKRLIQDFLQPYLDIINDATSIFQRMACIWCIETLVPLKIMKPEDWILVSYEDLVLNPIITINKILKYCKIDAVNNKDLIQSTPSLTVERTSAIIQKKNPLEVWKYKLSPNEINEILDIVRSFSLDWLYDEEIIPKKKF